MAQPNAAHDLPPFRPHPLLRSGHLQTLAGVYFPGELNDYRARQHQVALDDGDRLVLHDDCPEEWQPGCAVALLMHGLGGSHESVYMRRAAQKLCAHAVRAFRMDLRGCGAGIELARLPYHSGRSADAAAALRFISALCPHSPVTLIGYSLGGNIALKLAGESADRPPENLCRVMAVCPPADLAACSAWIGRWQNRGYDRYFARLLSGQLLERRRRAPHAVSVDFARQPKRLIEIDDWFTGPVCGFGNAANYYQQSSSAPLLADVRIPTQIIAAADDPLVPRHMFEALRLSPATSLHVARHGGHLGFIGARGNDADRRWLDWRVVDWVLRGPAFAAELSTRSGRAHVSPAARQPLSRT
ncbi:MAG TPA: alpha/beta fold hydrolase [Pirellulales bacterium]|nr:alpha/beta fold hydrolase [Pirellulales bacterium]